MHTPSISSLILALGLTLGACTGSGDDPSPAVTDDARPSVEPDTDIALPARSDAPVNVDDGQAATTRGRLQGLVVDATDGLALADAVLTLRAAGASPLVPPLAVVRTRSNGGYLIDGLPVDGIPLTMDVARADYLPERIGNVRATALEHRVSLERVRLVPAADAGIGTLGGVLSDIDGEPLAGVAIEFVPGIGRIAGDGVVTTSTGADGRWSIAGLDYGNWTCIVYGPDGTITTATVTVAAPARDGIEALALPALAADERLIVTTRGDWFQSMRIVLDAPDDDVDDAALGTLPRSIDTESSEPHVTRVRLGGGTLRYSLDKSFLASRWPTFDVTVRVIGPRGPIASYTPPDRGLTSSWTVFDMDLATGALIAGGRRR